MEKYVGTDGSQRRFAVDPNAKIENGAGALVSQSASAELIFSGCYSYMSLPWTSPVTAVSRNAATET